MERYKKFIDKSNASLFNKIHFTGNVKLKEKNNRNLNGSIKWVCNWSTQCKSATDL